MGGTDAKLKGCLFMVFFVFLCKIKSSSKYNENATNLQQCVAKIKNNLYLHLLSVIFLNAFA